MARGLPSDARGTTPDEDPRFATAARGQSSVIGLVLILGLALAGASAIVVFGASAIEDMQTNSQVEAAEHVMTQFDSQVSLVALDDTGSRTVSFGEIGGSYAVHPNTGHIEIVHINYSGTNDETIYSADMGEVVYRNGETTIAYQGGGVWRSDGSGDSSMVSPPEFNYRGATLTFPVIRVTDGNGASGRVKANIASPKATTDIYPSSATYPNGEPYINPASDGHVKVIVQSEYYEAWANYFRERTAGNVTVDAANQRIEVELISTGVTGDFQMPNEGSSLPIQGVGNHSLSDFSISLVPDDSDSAEFDNLKWTLHAEENDKQFEIHLRKGTDADDASTACKEDWVRATVYYSPSDDDSDDEDPYQGWYNSTAYKTECYDADGDGTKDEVRLVVDFVDDEDDDGDVAEVDSNDPMLVNKSLGQDHTLHYSPQKSHPIAAITFSEHQSDVSWESKTYVAGEKESIDRLTNHYFSKMDRVDLTVADKDSNTITESGSSGTIHYTGGSKYITFMHITENKVVVDFN